MPSPVAAFDLPAPSAVSFGTSATYGPDGLLYAFDGLNVLKQQAANTGSFAAVNSSPLSVAGSDAGPITFSNNGTSIFVGTGLGGFDFSGNSNGLTFALPAAGGAFTQIPGTTPGQYSFASYQGTAGRLLVNQGTSDFSGSFVSLYGTTSGDVATVIDNIPGASTAVGVDSDAVIVGIGFGPERGTLRRFGLAAVVAAATTSPLDFSAGELLNPADDSNSGTGIFQLPDGRIFVGQGSEGGVLVLFPDGGSRVFDLGQGFNTIAYNAVDDQFASFADGRALVFDTAGFIPEPATLSLAAVGLLGLVRRRAA
ncbi:MAG: PEP-CTERM sorting domain-containing protein [Phycisphaerae bacterium]